LADRRLPVRICTSSASENACARDSASNGAKTTTTRSMKGVPDHDSASWLYTASANIKMMVA